MAAHSNRSPSPISSRSTNPNSRSSEIYSTSRSLNGNNSLAKPSALSNPKRLDPITPANSPSEFARRRSVGSGSCLRNSEEKENTDEKDQLMKTSKLQSPAKGSKSFMAPTISAASKFTPSPRKKPLVERNHPVRTSISLSDGKAMFFSNVPEDFEPNPEMGYKQNPKTVAESVQVPKPSKKVTFSDSQNAKEIVSDSDSLKTSCSPVWNPIAPLDADPSTRPYDPKTNYLSPRPQFLYYKPNARLNIESVMDLEDEIMSDNYSSDSEGSQDSEKEKLEDIAQSDRVIGFEDDFHLYEETEKEKLEAIDSADTSEGLLEYLEDDLREDHVSVDSEKEKVEAIESADKVMGLEEEMDEDGDVIYIEKKENKSLIFSRLVCFSMFMVVMLMAGCVSISVTRSRPFEEFGLKDFSFSDLGNLYRQSIVAANEKAAKVDFHGLVRRINHLAINCVSFISKVANELGEGENKMGPLKYVNLSDLQMGSWNSGHFRSNIDEVISEHVEEDDEFDEGLDTEMSNFEEEEAYGEDDDDKDENFENGIDEQESYVLEIEEKMSTIYSSGLDSEKSEDTQSQSETIDVPSLSADENFENEIDEQEGNVLEIEEKMPTDLDFEYSEDTQSQNETIALPSVSADDQLAAVTIPHDAIEIVPSETVGTEKSEDEMKSDVDSSTESVQNPIISEILASYAAKEILSIFVAILTVAAAFVVYQRKKIPGLAANAVDVQEENKQEMSSSNWQREVDDDGAIGESSCPSEASSYYRNSKREETRGGASEAQSLEGKTKRHHNQSKRESLASSSSEFTMGGSYGSFTTYEKISIKNDYGEEEIITPVRRSSRIRKFTSP
ncbi:hypothetical protein CASFOL_035970 [Castilleja foliolosa]|uniref:Uncharacterized protein n=1 Tax=Castilleja foliolosa TaxID=1961234 RepID=A0ABD3BU80_9LAMI